MKQTFTARGCTWTDCTSYDQRDKERIPKSFSTQVAGAKILITNGHIHHRPDFIFHCRDLSFDTQTIVASSHKEAAEIAFDMCHHRASTLCESFRKCVENK